MNPAKLQPAPNKPPPPLQCDPNRVIRLKELLRIVPVAASTWWSWVRQGRAPAPIKLGPRTTCWRATDIVAFIEQSGNTPEKHLAVDVDSMGRAVMAPSRKPGAGR